MFDTVLNTWNLYTPQGLLVALFACLTNVLKRKIGVNSSGNSYVLNTTQMTFRKPAKNDLWFNIVFTKLPINETFNESTLGGIIFIPQVLF